MGHSTLLPPIRMTRAEFDAWAPNQDIPYELIDGRVEPKYLSDDGLYAMAGGRVSHHYLITRAAIVLDRRTTEDCSAIVDTRVRIGETTILIPDVVVTCEPLHMEGLDVTSPVLIVEVLSPSTQRQDRTTKLDAYREIAALREIWFIRTKPRHVEVWQRRPEGWHVADVIGSGVIQSLVLTAPVPLDELYDRLPI